jgi:hypothetical protein
MLIRAGIFCETDKINGVSANIMLGQVPPCGTGDGDIIMDVDAIMQVDPEEVSRDRKTKIGLTDEDEAFFANQGEEGALTDTVRLPDTNQRIAEKDEDEIVVV